jgi:hypothetical protein
MTTPNPDPPQTDPPDESRIRSIVSDALAGLFTSGKAKVAEGETAPAKVDRQADIEAQVTKGVKAAKSEEKQESLIATLQADVASLRAKLEAPPVRRRPVEKAMGWHLDEEN